MAASAAVKATEAGLPALAGIDPILQIGLGSEYAKTYEATTQAGYLVAKMMRRKGYEPIGQGSLPDDCVAKSAAIYRRVEGTD
jgi:hypothetical protein